MQFIVFFIKKLFDSTNVNKTQCEKQPPEIALLKSYCEKMSRSKGTHVKWSFNNGL